jgi:hypothetical protein
MDPGIFQYQYMKPIVTLFTVIGLPVVLFGVVFAGMTWYSNFSASASSSTDQTQQTSSSPNDSENPPDEPTIYVSIVTHSEDTQSPGTPDFAASESATLQERDGVIAFAQMLSEHGAKYDWQSDWNFLLGLLAWDEGSSETNGKNLAEYLVEDLGMSADPHSHQHNGYNYADVAYLLRELGVTPSGIVGGFIAAPESSSEYDDLSSTLKGSQYPSYSWTPTALWGGGTGLHINESAQWASGIWIPTSEADLYTPATEGTPIIGRYDGDFNGLDDLLEKQAAGELEAGNMYTITITTNQNMLTDDYIAEFETKIATYADEAAAGNIVWVTLPEALSIWETQYQSNPTILEYDGNGTTSPLSPRTGSATSDTLPPTSGNSSLEKNTGACGDGICALPERINNTCPADC